VSAVGKLLADKDEIIANFALLKDDLRFAFKDGTEIWAFAD
jgi:hypothetical protein